jgi:hypothetical protein
MTIDEHIEKWRRFDAARAVLDPAQDFELWFWAMLSAGTALVNAALHAAGITRENHLFATQMPHVYAVHDGAHAWHHELADRCDLIHVGIPELDCALPPEIAHAFAAMEVLETHRDPCVRSTVPVTAEITSACCAAYADAVAVLFTVLRARSA